SRLDQLQRLFIALIGTIELEQFGIQQLTRRVTRLSRQLSPVARLGDGQIRAQQAGQVMAGLGITGFGGPGAGGQGLLGIADGIQQIAVAGSRRLRSRTGGGGGRWRRCWRWRNTASEGLDLGRAGALITDPQRIQGLGRRRTPGITGTYGTAAAVTLAGDASEFRRLGMGVGVLLEKGGQDRKST